MKRTVLVPHDSSSRPLWKARVITASHSARAGVRVGIGLDQLHADHQAPAANLADARVVAREIAQLEVK